jgi:hypothetical protein
MTSGTELTVCGRDRALLRAVAAGRCQVGAGCEPVLLVDGLGCADSSAAFRLLAAGLIQRPVPGLILGPAVLTDAGRRALPT